MSAPWNSASQKSSLMESDFQMHPIILLAQPPLLPPLSGGVVTALDGASTSSCPSSAHHPQHVAILPPVPRTRAGSHYFRLLFLKVPAIHALCSLLVQTYPISLILEYTIAILGLTGNASPAWHILPALHSTPATWLPRAPLPTPLSSSHTHHCLIHICQIPVFPARPKAC